MLEGEARKLLTIVLALFALRLSSSPNVLIMCVIGTIFNPSLALLVFRVLGCGTFSSVDRGFDSSGDSDRARSASSSSSS